MNDSEQVPFPFVGAGEAQYFEWAEMFVCFERVPDDADREAISAEVPPPLQDTIDWKGTLLWVASEQGVGRLIKAAYGKKKGKPAALTTQSRFSSAPVGADEAFNADIERWLRAAHARVPIMVAFRREDLEAGGTDLSPWHHQSVTKLPEILPHLTQPEYRAAAVALGKRLITAAKAGGLSVDDTYERAFEAAREEAKADEDKAREAERDAKRAAFAAAMAEKSAPPGKTIDPKALNTALDEALPRAAKRLRKAKDHALRPRATAKAIAAVEKELGVKLAPEHKALLQAFDGGRVGEVVFLGTEAGGTRGEDSITTFTRAWNGDDSIWVVAVARTGHGRVLAWQVEPKHELYLFDCEPGFGSGRIERLFKNFDGALDAILKAGRV